MKVAICAGDSSESIIEGIKRKVTGSGIDFLSIRSIEDVDSIYERGEYFDKIIIVENSILSREEFGNTELLRSRVYDFVECNKRRATSSCKFIFLVSDEKTASIISDEIVGIRAERVILVKEQPYAVAFFKSLVVCEFSKFPDKYVYKPTPIESKIKEDNSKYVTDKDEKLAMLEQKEEEKGSIHHDLSSDIDELFAQPKTEIETADIDDTGLVDDDIEEIEEIEEEDEEGLEEIEEIEELEEETDEIEEIEELEEIDELEETDELEELEETEQETEEELEETEEELEETCDIEEIDEEVEEINNSDYDEEVDELEEIDDEVSDIEDIEEETVEEIDELEEDAIEFNDNKISEDELEEVEEIEEEVDEIEEEVDEIEEVEEDTAYEEDELIKEEDACKEVEGNEKEADKEYAETEKKDDTGIEEVEVYEESDNFIMSEEVSLKGNPAAEAFGSNLYEELNNENNLSNEGATVGEELFNSSEYEPASKRGIGRNRRVRAKHTDNVIDMFANKGTSIIVTGSKASGKSTVAFNLANSLARSGYQTLIVDLDTKHKAQSFMSKQAVDGIDNDNVSLKSAVNSNKDIMSFVNVIRPGVHHIGSGLNVETQEMDEMFNIKRLTKFIVDARRNYNFVIYDVSIDDFDKYIHDVVEYVEEILIVAEASNYGLTNTVLDIFNIESEDLYDAVFSKGKIIYNKCRNTKRLLGRKVENLETMMDKLAASISGYEAEGSMRDIECVGFIPYIDNADGCMYEKEQISDDDKVKDMFMKIIKNVLNN